MREKYLQYFKDDQQALLYAGCYCDPLYNSKLDELNASDELKLAGKQVLAQRLNLYLKQDKVQREQ